VVEDVGRRLRLSVNHADVAGLWRAVGRLSDRPDIVESILIQLTRLGDLASRRHAKRYRWHGRVMAAVDVTDVELGSSRAMINAYGGPHDALGRIRMAHGKLIVVLDVRRRVILGWHLAPYKSSERDLLREVITGLEPKTVLLLDRGYPSRALFALARERQLDVIVRVPGGKAAWRTYQTLLRKGSGLREGYYQQELPDNSHVAVRVIVRPCRRGRPYAGTTAESMTLMTTLINAELSSLSILAAYDARWDIEIFFRNLKTHIAQVENWHSTTPHRLWQEIAIHLIWFTIGAVLELEHHRWAERSARLKDGMAINLALAYHRLVQLVLDVFAGLPTDCVALFERMSKTLVPIMPDRHYPRVCLTALGRTRK
jgi:hypothetical protein